MGLIMTAGQINPSAFTERVLKSYLRYQLTAYPFTDEVLREQMKQLLSLENSRRTPLFKGPYVSLSRAFRDGASIAELVTQNVLHPLLCRVAPYAKVRGHQEQAIRAIVGGQHTLVSTGTGSGKTEAFLYPIISRCLKLRDENAAPGVVAVLIYPMNALAEDQLDRLRDLLAGTGVRFGMYVGKTPERESDVNGRRMGPQHSHEDYRSAIEKSRGERVAAVIHPFEEACSREAMRDPQRKPSIILTNVKQLELLLTRQVDAELFSGARLEYLVVDEAHTFAGSMGAETASLIRRLRAYCEKGPDSTVCIATSATIASNEGDGAPARNFASRFFGVDPDKVTLVREAYEPDQWAAVRSVPAAPSAKPAEVLAGILESLSQEETALAAGLKIAFEKLKGGSLGEDWRESLGKAMSENELVYQLADFLSKPKSLDALCAELSNRVGRPVSEEEVIAWLILGAEARVGERPFLRPVIHGFIRGMSGAVVTFPIGTVVAKLWLAAEDAVLAEAGGTPLAKLAVTTCVTCGQHYFVHHAKDFRFTGEEPEGGEAVGDGRFWPAGDPSLDGKRVVLTDRLIGADEDDDEPSKTAALQLCRFCGALHPEKAKVCLSCARPSGLVRLMAIQTWEKKPGWLASCRSCKTKGSAFGFYREPARALRAVQVADVHVLAQEMLQNAVRKRLLIFADNRQEAAFQAGWMRDRARRFRLREMMHRHLVGQTYIVGDLVGKLDEELEADNSLSQQLLREVWDQHDKDDSPTDHRRERKHYLRIQVLREITPTFKQRIGLEPWGKLQVDYAGLEASNLFAAMWAPRLQMDAGRLSDGMAACLDLMRRKFYLYDGTEIYSRFPDKGSKEIQYGYYQEIQGVPKGMKLTRDPGDDENRVDQWLGENRSLMSDIAHKWGVSKEDTPEFLTGLWDEVVRLGLLVAVNLKGMRGNNLPNTSGTRQIDANKLRLQAHNGRWRCNRCRRVQVRPAPLDRCLAWNCSGILVHEVADPDNYDLQVLEGSYGLLKPREHTAQVPTEDREYIERNFKDEAKEVVNTLVATQTLEMGVDIGPLDVVLMRNIPPFPANYWQRVGRAGRRFRMAVNLAYARENSHDRAYFKDPMRMLAGQVEPPSFNLRNALMVAKHVHACVLTRLFQEARGDAGIKAAVDVLFPSKVKSYFFHDDNTIRLDAFDFAPLATLIQSRQQGLLAYISNAFTQNWPEADSATVSSEALNTHLNEMPQALADTIQRVRRRLEWAMGQITRLNDIQSRQGSLSPEEEALRRRCEDLIKKLKGLTPSQNRGYDPSNTFNLLSGEGFLPGYGLDTGLVRGFAMVPKVIRGIRDFELPRPTASALREIVPGNRIYANGHSFVPRFYHLQNNEPLSFHVDLERQAVSERGAPGQGTQIVSASSVELLCIPMGDVNLTHISRIGDGEENRFQLPVVVIGSEQGRHAGGQAYRCGDVDALFRRNVHFRLVNAGASSEFSDGNLGFLVCRVCGDSRSPFSSDTEIEKFLEKHRERCAQEPGRVGFYTDAVADAISFPSLASVEAAVSLVETIRLAASSILEMEVDDLEILCIPHPSQETVTAILFDPMPGGSGLLQQLLDRFPEVHAESLRLTRECPGACERSCIDCLQHYRNLFNHKHLDRGQAFVLLERMGNAMQPTQALPSQMPAAPAEEGHAPGNAAESGLKAWIAEAGLPEGEWQRQIRLGPPLGSTTPDCYYDDPSKASEGICIYLDGLSRNIHGNASRQAQDRDIRSQLRAMGYEVLELAATDLQSRQAMGHFLARLGRLLVDAEKAKSIRATFTANTVAFPGMTTGAGFTRIDAKNARAYEDSVPIFTLQAAAGSFSESQIVEQAEEWAKINVMRKLEKGMFVAQVVGKSMEPTIPTGAWCLFRSPTPGSRAGRIVVVQHKDIHDLETQGSYTIKRWKSKKEIDGEGTWKHVEIVLTPDNPDAVNYRSIVLKPEHEGDVMVVAEFVEVLG
jgi:ATP-dependent helicase YprA (DUF1998 family)